MRLSQKYGECTAEGCNKVLMEINNLDDTITIGELRTYLYARAFAAKKAFDEEAESLIKSVSNKCFKIVFSEDHICYLKIDKIKTVEVYGSLEGVIEGESITIYKGQISHKLIEKDDKRYSNYFPNKDCTEITAEEFQSKKTLIQHIIAS